MFTPASKQLIDNPALTQALIPAILDSSLYRYKQKKGKKRMRQIGNVEVPQSAFLAVLKMD